MKEIIEKQVLEWKAELTVQKQKKLQAEQALDEANRTILMIEGGIQFAQLSLKKHESTNLQSNTADLKPKSEKGQPNS